MESVVQLLPIDGSKLRDRWFPNVKADVFIAHSHQDKEMALKCASWLNGFDLEPFVDSCVWGSADDLLRIIDEKYCKNEDQQTFSYEKRNETTSHIHMMLATALTEMLDATECVFFMNTPDAITPTEAISKTKSPWLFYELTSINRIRRKKPERRCPMSAKSASIPFEVRYEVPLENLTSLTVTHLGKWWEKWKEKRKTDRKTHPLDLFYELHPE